MTCVNGCGSAVAQVVLDHAPRSPCGHPGWRGDGAHTGGAQAVGQPLGPVVHIRRDGRPVEGARLISNASSEIDILVYAGLFLTEDPALIKTFRAKAAAGAKIRLLFGDPRSREVAKRSAEENIGPATIAAKIRNVLAFFRPLADEPAIEIRLHKTTLYNSIYRFDDDMFVNTHVYGSMAAHAPVLHLRRLSGGDLFDTYSESFDVIWNESKPATWTT